LSARGVLQVTDVVDRERVAPGKRGVHHPDEAEGDAQRRACNGGPSLRKHFVFVGWIFAIGICPLFGRG